MRTTPVSVVIPHFNAPAELRRALQSAISQSAPPREIIVVDDASTTENFRRVESLISEHSVRSKLDLLRIHDNSGPATARNLGWNVASEPFVAFLDADDSWHPEKLSIQTKAMDEGKGWDLLGHLVSLPASDTPPAAFERQPSVRPSGVLSNDILRRSPFSTPSVMIRTHLTQRFEAGSRYCEDYDLWLRLHFNGYRVGRLPLQLASLHKSAYGAAGLSSHLWRMERGELDAFCRLRREGLITRRDAASASTLSLAKYLRRVAIVGSRRLRG